MASRHALGLRRRPRVAVRIGHVFRENRSVLGKECAVYAQSRPAA